MCEGTIGASCRCEECCSLDCCILLNKACIRGGDPRGPSPCEEDGIGNCSRMISVFSEWRFIVRNSWFPRRKSLATTSRTGIVLLLGRIGENLNHDTQAAGIPDLKTTLGSYHSRSCPPLAESLSCFGHGGGEGDYAAAVVAAGDYGTSFDCLPLFQTPRPAAGVEVGVENAPEKEIVGGKAGRSRRHVSSEGYLCHW